MKNMVINLFGNNKIVPNTGVKYSKLLEQFMNPFMADFKDYEYIEDIFEFAINAWNTANVNNIIPSEDVEKAINSIEQNKDDILLLKRMLAHKEEKFKGYTNFIVDFELKEVNDGGDPILSVVTQEEDAYLTNMMDSLDNEVTEEDFEENYINRSAIILKPQQPFLDWCSNLNPDDDFEEDIKETNIYLVDDKIDDVEKWLKKKFDKFFMMELDEWCADKKEWPQRRNYKMFTLWFRIETSEMIYDLEKKPVLKLD